MEGAERAPGSPQRPRLGRSGGWRWRERPPCDGDQGVTNPEVGRGDGWRRRGRRQRGGGADGAATGESGRARGARGVAEE